MGILLFSSLSRYILDSPVIWGVEMAQFVMVVYFTVGGAFSLLLNAHVRMDILYSRWSYRGRAIADILTFFFLISYLLILIYGCYSSTAYSIQYNQHNNTAWGPPIAPVKILIGVGLILMILQSFSEFLKDIARCRKLEIEEPVPERLLLDASSDSKVGRRGFPVPRGIPLPIQIQVLKGYDNYSFL
jgi:TRAP-type mannitol/chloroaromatic compound transport system permease small subunit